MIKFIRSFLIPRTLRRAAANDRKPYGGPPFGREPFEAPQLYNPSRDLDGMDHAVRMRSRALAMCKAVANG